MVFTLLTEYFENTKQCLWQRVEIRSLEAIIPSPHVINKGQTSCKANHRPLNGEPQFGAEWSQDIVQRLVGRFGSSNEDADSVQNSLLYVTTTLGRNSFLTR